MRLILETLRYIEYAFMAVDGLVTRGARASVAMIASLLTVPNLCMSDASSGAQQHIKVLRFICCNLIFVKISKSFSPTQCTVDIAVFSPKNSIRVRYGVSFVSLLSEVTAFHLSYFVLHNIVLYLTARY